MSRLNILWTTDNVATISSLLLPYTTNSIGKGWWDEVHVVIWGGSTKLIAEDKSVKEILEKMIATGVTFEACQYCSDKYNATDMLKNLGVDVKYMGSPLTEYLKSDDKFLSL